MTPLSIDPKKIHDINMRLSETQFMMLMSAVDSASFSMEDNLNNMNATSEQKGFARGESAAVLKELFRIASVIFGEECQMTIVSLFEHARKVTRGL